MRASRNLEEACNPTGKSLRLFRLQIVQLMEPGNWGFRARTLAQRGQARGTQRSAAPPLISIISINQFSVIQPNAPCN
jgi:hypothetical protein